MLGLFDFRLPESGPFEWPDPPPFQLVNGGMPERFWASWCSAWDWQGATDDLRTLDLSDERVTTFMFLGPQPGGGNAHLLAELKEMGERIGQLRDGLIALVALASERQDP
jgi:hypothetical protein